MRISIRKSEVEEMSISEALQFLKATQLSGVKVELDPRDVTADDYSESTIVQIYTDKEGRHIHYYGYGYYAHQGEDKPYRFLEYTWFIAPLEEALEMGLYEYESENCDQYKTYITDCTEEECKEFYERYDNGEMPKLIFVDEVNMDTPDGVYIMVKR